MGRGTAVGPRDGHVPAGFSMARRGRRVDAHEDGLRRNRAAYRMAFPRPACRDAREDKCPVSGRQLVWTNHRPAVAQTTELLHVNVDETRDRDALCFEAAESLAGNPSRAPQPNLTCRFDLTFEPASKI